MTSATRLQTSQQWKDLLDSVDTMLFDCDGRSFTESEELIELCNVAHPIVHAGVFWVGDSDPIEGAKEAMQYIRDLVCVLKCVFPVSV